MDRVRRPLLSRSDVLDPPLEVVTTLEQSCAQLLQAFLVRRKNKKKKEKERMKSNVKKKKETRKEGRKEEKDQSTKRSQVKNFK